MNNKSSISGYLQEQERCAVCSMRYAVWGMRHGI